MQYCVRVLSTIPVESLVIGNAVLVPEGGQERPGSTESTVRQYKYFFREKDTLLSA